jgi:predicted ATPase with chaperone activity
VPPEELTRTGGGECSASIRTRVTAARERQLARQDKANARLAPSEVDAHCTPDAQGAALLGKAIVNSGFRRAVITASSRWRERSRTSMVSARCRLGTSPKRFSTAGSTGPQ